MFCLARAAVISCALLFFCNIAVAQFLPEDQIPLEIQNQIIADVIAEHGHLDMAALETAFREWLLSQPLPDADGVMLDAGTCSDCSPPTDGEDLQFPPVRDVEIITREGRIRPSFKVRWRRPVRLPREIRDLYELDSYEVFLTRDDGVFEHHQITKELRADGTERLPRRIRFRRRDPGVYTVHVRPVYVEVEQTEAASGAPSSGPASGSALAGSTEKNNGPTTRGGLSTGGGKGPWGGGSPAPLSPTDSVGDVFLDQNGVLNGTNDALALCILERTHFGIRTLPNGGTVQGHFDYTETTLLQEIDFLDCSDPDTNPYHGVITSIAQMDNFIGLRSLKLRGNAVVDITPLSADPNGPSDLNELDLTDNTTVQLSGLSGLDALQHLSLGGLSLTSLPALHTNINSLVSYSLANNDLGAGSFMCLGTPIPVSFLDISNNELNDADLTILRHLTPSSLDASNNRFEAFKEPSNCPGVFTGLNSIDLSDNGGVGGGFGKKTLSTDISGLTLSALNLSGSDFTDLPADLPVVCLDLNLSNMTSLNNWEYSQPDPFPAARPYTFNVSGSNELACKDSESFRYWMGYGDLGQAPGGGTICPNLELPYSDLFAAECDAGQVDGFVVDRSTEQPHHLASWDALYLERDFRDFEYRVQKRLAGIHDPNSDDGIIPPTYQYGATGHSVIADTQFELAYEFRIQRCLVDNGVAQCEPDNWSDWQVSGYPLIAPINAQVVWTDPIAGDFYITWSYPENYFEGNRPDHFLITPQLGGSFEIAAGAIHQTQWGTNPLAPMNINAHGLNIAVSACHDNSPAQDTCASPVYIRVNQPPEFGSDLVAPVLGSAATDGNEGSFSLQNLGNAADGEGLTTVDYYQITEQGPGGLTVYYKDISGQSPGEVTAFEFKRIEGGNYNFTVQACQRNRDGQDRCSNDPNNNIAVNDLTPPLGFNEINDSLCWTDLGGSAVQLQWQYSDDNGAFDTPHSYHLEPVVGVIPTPPFSALHSDITDPTTGASVVSTNTATGGEVSRAFWRIDACDAGGSCLQGVGYINAGVTDAGNAAQCPSAPPEQTRNVGGPGNLRPGIWTSQQLPRQGWTFYWASDLRYDEVHEDYGDTYDLFAYWQTYQLREGVNGAADSYQSVWLYAELKQEEVDNAPCGSDGELVFNGGLYFPSATAGAPDMHAGDMQVCFDPDDNNVVDIALDVHLDGQLQTDGYQSYQLGEITNDTATIPQPSVSNPTDYHNGSFRFGLPTVNQDKTRLVSWNYGYLEGLIVLGFDTAGLPFWANGVLDCRLTQTEITEGIFATPTCDNPFTANDLDDRPRLQGAQFRFSTARFGLPALATPPANPDDLVSVRATSNSVTRDKAAHIDDIIGPAAFDVSGSLGFTIVDENGATIRSFNDNFDTEAIRRQASFHNIRYAIGDDTSPPTDCNIVDGVCNISLTWFSDADFLGDGTPSIAAYYQLDTNSDGQIDQEMLLDGNSCGAGAPLTIDFAVVNYPCALSTPGNYRFVLKNRVDANGVPTAESNNIAASTTLTVIGEGNTANDNLGVAPVADTPLQIGQTVHDHNAVPHQESIGVLAGEAGVSGGAATYSVPINIPPGRQGMQPSVSLNYNSRAGNGTLGMGWSLSAGSAISRCPSTIAQDGFTKGVIYDDTDRLCLDGQRLIKVEGGLPDNYWSAGSVYRTEVDSFVRVTLSGSNAAISGCGSTFQVQGKDNITRDYGGGSNAEVRPSGSTCVTNSWLLTQEQDPAGNNVQYQYQNHGDGEQLLASIAYTGFNSGAGNRLVEFDYQGRSGDESVSYLNGYRSEQTQRLAFIRTFVDKNNVGSNWIREYRVGYQPGGSAATGRSLLTSVTECARQGTSGQVCLPATSFAWGDQAPMFDWQAITTDQDDDGVADEMLVNGDPLGYDLVNGRINGGQLQQVPDLDGDGSRELTFSDQNGRYIASIDAEGQERWRVNLGFNQPNSPSQFIPMLGDDTQHLLDLYQPVIQQYADGIDIAARLPADERGSLTPAQELEMRSQVALSVEQELERLLEQRRNAIGGIDFDSDGITDLVGAVPDTANPGEYVLGFILRRDNIFNSNDLEDLFEVRRTNIPVPLSTVTGSPFFQSVVGDINGDGALDVLDRVSLSVTNSEGSVIGTEGLRLWVNIDDPATEVVEFEVLSEADGAIPTNQQNSSNPVAGLVYIWPVSVMVDSETGPMVVREISAIPSLSDYNGDGLVDIVISSQILDLFYEYHFGADVVLDVIEPLGYSEAPVRVLLNQTDSADNIDFALAELSADTVHANDPNSRGSSHLGLHSDPRLTYQLPLDINGDGLQDYLFIPNNVSRAANQNLCGSTNPHAADGCWYVQINLGGATDSVEPIFSAPMALDLPGNIVNSMETLDTSTSSILVSPNYGNMIKVVDWNNDGRSELMIPRALERAACVMIFHKSDPMGTTPIERGEYCPVNMNGDDSVYPIGISAGTEVDPDFNSGTLLYGEIQQVGYGHLDPSTYQMGVLEFDQASLTGNTVVSNLIDSDVTGIIATARSMADDGFGDGITDLLTVFGCIEEDPDNFTVIGLEGTRCWTTAPVATGNSALTDNGLIDDAATTAYAPGMTSGEFRGYYITRNIAPRDQTLDLMTLVTDGFNHQSAWGYAPLSANPDRPDVPNLPLYVVPDRTSGDGYVDNGVGEYFYFSSSMYVVSEFHQNNGLLDAGTRLNNSTYFGYEEAVYNNQGRGFQGFRKIVSEQVVSDPFNPAHEADNNLRSVSVFHQIFPLAGRLEATYSQLSSVAYDPLQDRATGGGFALPDTEPMLSYSLTDWGCRIESTMPENATVALCNIDDAHTPGQGISAALAEVTHTTSEQPGIYHPVSSYTESEQYEPGIAGSVAFSRTTGTYDFDAYGNLIESTVLTTDNIDLDLFTDMTHQQHTVNDYTVQDNASWWLNRMDSSVTTSTIVSYADSMANTAVAPPVRTTTQLMSYDTDLRKPDCQLITEGDQSDADCATFNNANLAWQRTQTNYNYPQSPYGNPVDITITASDLAASDSTQPDRKTTTTYDGEGYFPSSVENAVEHTVYTTIDAREGNPIKVIDANGLVTRMAYDAFGREIETWYPQDENIDETLITQHYAPRSSTRYSSSCPGMSSPDGMAYCMSVITDGAPVVHQAMDSLNRVLRTHSAGFDNTVVVEQQYNARGQVISDSIPRYDGGLVYTNEYLFDPLGRMQMKIQPQQATMDPFVSQDMYTHYVHNGLSTEVTVTTSAIAPSQGSCSVGIAGNVHGDLLCVQRSYASNGWLLRTIDAHGEPTRFWYDGQGNPIRIEDPQPNATTATYNDLGHRIQLVDPNMGTWDYSYNGLGEVIAQTDANSNVFTFNYDRLGRLREQETAGLCNRWDYDSPNNEGLLISEQRDDCSPGGQLIPLVRKVYDYDGVNRPMGVQQQLNHPNTTVNAMSMGYSYDSYFGRMQAMTWSVDGTGDGTSPVDVVRLYSKYNINGYLVEQGDSINYGAPADGVDYNQPINSAWRRIQSMTPNGQLQAQRYKNGQTQTTQYYQATWQMRQTTLPDDLNVDNPPLLDYFYEYDLFGNLKQQVRHSLDGVGGPPISELETFTYDRLHRLLSSHRMYNNGDDSQIDYDYDALGNLTNKSDYGSGYTYGGNPSACGNANAGPNAVTSLNLTANAGGGIAQFGYDANGNLICGRNIHNGNLDIVYDAYNKPTSITRGLSSNEFWYGADQQRYLQRKNNDGAMNQTTVYLDKAYERTGNIHKLYLDDFAVFTVDYETPLADETGITYLHKDRLGSVAVMSKDNGVSVTDSDRGYDPFGKPREGDWHDSSETDETTGYYGDLNGFSETTRGFTGHEHMNGTDLIHMNGRAYDYNLGRFLSVDPVIQFPTNSQSLNPYSYIMNNPLAGTDPTGYTIAGAVKGVCEQNPELCEPKEENRNQPKNFGTGRCSFGASCGGVSLDNGTAGTGGTINQGSNQDSLGARNQQSPNANALNAMQQMDGAGCRAPLLCAQNPDSTTEVLLGGTDRGSAFSRWWRVFRKGIVTLSSDIVDGDTEKLSGFVAEEGVDVLGRTATVVGGGAQIALGTAICAGSGGLACAGGVGIGTLGASNIQEGFSGSDGFVRDGLQATLGEDAGDITFGVLNLGSSVIGLTRPVLREGSFKLFRRSDSDFEPAFRQATKAGLTTEGIVSGIGIIDTVDRANDDE